jgi:hypothetical protein
MDARAVRRRVAAMITRLRTGATATLAPRPATSAV